MASLSDIEALLQRELAPLKQELARLSSEVASLRTARDDKDEWTSLKDESPQNNSAGPAITLHGDTAISSSQTVDAKKNAEDARNAADARRRNGQRPVEIKYDDTPLLTPGKTVRVARSNDSRKAMIMCVDGEDVEVEFEDGDKTIEEVVSVAALRPLEPFELRSADLTNKLLRDVNCGPEQLKNEGNELFKLKDFVAAVHHYGLAIDFLKALPSDKVVFSAGGALVAHTVRWEGSTAITQDGRRIESKQVVNVSSVELQTALYVNRSRANSSLDQNQLAAQDLSLAIALWDHNLAHPQRAEKLAKAYYLRAKSRLARQKFEAARLDVKACSALEVPENTSMLHELERRINWEQKDLQRSNKVLAREISKWADGAFSDMQS